MINTRKNDEHFYNVGGLLTAVIYLLLIKLPRSKDEINSLEDELKQCRYQIEHLSNQLQLFQNSAPYRTPQIVRNNIDEEPSFEITILQL